MARTAHFFVRARCLKASAIASRLLPSRGTARGLIEGWEAVDLEALVSLLHDEVVTTMPPSPTWIAGLAANREFYQMMFEARAPGALRFVPTAANGQPALAFYRAPEAGAARRLSAIEVLDVRAGSVVRIDHFMTRRVFPLFALPEALS